VADAVAMAEAGLAFLAGADLASEPVGTQAECLRGLARVESLHTVARSGAITAFGCSGGYEADGQYSAKSWLRWQTQATPGAAGAAVSWARRLAAHPAVRAALAAREISVSWAWQICAWSERLPEEARAGADVVLLAAAAGGFDLAGLSGLAERIFWRCVPPDTDDGRDFTDRSLALDLTFGGAGRLVADLTPECAAAVMAVLEALGKKMGPEDDRSLPQRQHDALEEACRRVVASGWLPDRAGQPAQVQYHMTLDQLRGLDSADGAATQAWMAGRAAADGPAGWILDRVTAGAYACDAQIAPVVTGHVDRAAVALAVRTFMAAAQSPAHGTGVCTVDGCDLAPGPAGDHQDRGPLPLTFGELADLFLKQAVEVLSGPAGLAAHLRGAVGGPAATGVSLPLDVGAATATIPPHLRRAVIPRSQGGTTSLTNLVLLCPFHHLIMIHRHGWALALSADGTTTATSPDGQRTWHSHSPPTLATAL
jgi:hypothetical protein